MRWSLCSTVLVLVPTIATAAPEDDGEVLGIDAPSTQIYGGDETEQCAWPSVVYLATGNSACTGALVHPQIVLTAAHCVPGDVSASVRFGERSEVAVELAATEYCRAYPGFVNTATGDDFGFCKLAAPVDNIPVTPIAFGCEESILGTGTQVTHVGYGRDQDGGSGRKKFVSLPVNAVTPAGEIITGGANTGICSGDSGGPVMTRLASSLGGDDTWRVIGIHSWAQMAAPGECNGVAGSVIASRAIDFIEQESGIDVTPCFTADGAWDPTWGCQGFPIDPGQGGEGSYAAMCETGPLGGFSELCGAPLSANPDVDPPTLQVLSPAGNTEFEVGAGGQADVPVEATVGDGDGWGVAGVELVIAPVDGEMVTQTLEYAPYRWNTSFPAGAYNLKLVATDNAGNQTESEWISIGVGVEAPTPPGADTTGTGDGDTSGEGDDVDDTGDGSGGTGEPAIDGTAPSGCGCAGSSPGDGGVALLTFAAVAGLRRRRRGASAT